MATSRDSVEKSGWGVTRGILGCEIKGPLRGPRDVIRFNKDTFLVTDGKEKAVFLVDHGGQEMKKLKIQEDLKEKFSPMGISSFREEVFVTDMGNQCIHRYDDLDNFPTQFGQGLLKKPTGIDVSPDNGTVFVVDNGKKTVAIFNRNGNFEKAINYLAHTGHVPFNNPQMVAINEIGDKLFVADQDDHGNNLIKVVNVFEDVHLKPIPVRFRQFQAKPYGIAIGKDSTIYITAHVVQPNEVEGRREVQREGPRGRGAGDGPKKVEKPIPKGVVIVYNTDGRYCGYFGTFPHQLDGPGGLVVVEDKFGVGDGDGSLSAYVVDSPLGEFRSGALKRFIL